MQKKENKRFFNSNLFPISPLKPKVPQRKSSTYKLKRGLNYTENREPELHLTNTYIQKKENKTKKKKEKSDFPFKLSTVWQFETGSDMQL